MPHETKAEAETENEEDDEKDEYKYESLPSSLTDSDTVSGDKDDEDYGMGGAYSAQGRLLALEFEFGYGACVRLCQGTPRPWSRP